MPIILENNKIKKIYSGSNSFNKVYIGSNLVHKANNINYVDYIESTGTQYIDTGYAFKTKTQKIECELSITASGGYAACGSYTANRNGVLYGMILKLSSSEMFMIGQSKYTASKSFSLNTRYNIILESYNSSYRIKFGNLFDVTGSCNPIYAITAINHFIFNANGSSSINLAPAKMKLYSYKMYDNGVLVRDYRPVKDANGVYCPYDEVEKKYYYNAGTGSFSGA